MKVKKMDVLKLIKNRQTVRKYKNSPISKNIIEQIIEAGRWGPSVHGFQPWRFIVITNMSLIIVFIIMANLEVNKFNTEYHYYASNVIQEYQNFL